MTKKEQIIRLRSTTALSDDEIARRVDCHPAYVRVACHQRHTPEGLSRHSAWMLRAYHERMKDPQARARYNQRMRDYLRRRRAADRQEA